MNKPECDIACLFLGTTGGSPGLTYSFCKELNASGKLKKYSLAREMISRNILTKNLNQK